MTERSVRWETTLNDLDVLYKDIERRSLSLPGFSLAPFAIGMWNVIKFEFCFFFDVLVLLPMTVITFLRNLFPGRWSYRSFSGRYWKYVLVWLWRGEAPTAPLGLIRPIVTFMVNAHVHNRFRAIQRQLYLDEALTEEERDRVSKRLAAAMEHWKRPTAAQAVYAYVFPAISPSAFVANHLFPGALPQWARLVGFLLVGYALTFIVSGFMFKRSLMLGASGRAAYFPGAIAGNHGYAKERAILNSVGITIREWPVDIALSIISLGIGFLSLPAWSGMYATMGIASAAEQLRVQMLAQGALFVTLAGMILYLRRRSGRS
jgi:hypothetical protein